MIQQKVVTRSRPVMLHPRDLIFTGLIILLAVVFLGKSLEFSVLGYIRILALTMAMTGIAAVGQTLVVITGGIDLSIGSLIAFTSVIIALVANQTSSVLGVMTPVVAAVIGLTLATGIGWIHGKLISDFNLAPFVVTFGSMSILRGLALVTSNGATVNLNTNTFGWLWGTVLGALPIAIVLMFAIYAVVGYLLRNSRFGRYLYAIGSNETVARLSGINVNATRQRAYAISGFLAGFVGLLMLAQIEGGIYSNGDGYELLTIAAVIIGGTSLKGGTGGVWGTLGGILLLSMVRNGLILYSVPPLWNDVITGSVIVIAALIDVQRRKLQESTMMAPNPPPVVSPPASIQTFDQALSQFLQTVEDRFGYNLIRVYFVDRETNELIEARTRTANTVTLAYQSFSVGRPLYIDDVRHDRYYKVELMHPDIRAVATIPIMHQFRVIGIIELQSEIVGTFRSQTLESITALVKQHAGTMEDAWLQESGWLNKQVRECLRNLPDAMYLEKSTLGEWLFPWSEAGSRGNMLKHVIHDAIESLNFNNADQQSRTARRYQVLKQTYINQKTVDAIVNDLGLSRRQYFYDLKESIDLVLHYIISDSYRKNSA